MAMQNAADSTAAKMKRGAIARSRKHDYVVRLLRSQSTTFRAGAFLENFFGTAIASIQHSRAVTSLGSSVRARRTYIGGSVVRRARLPRFNRSSRVHASPGLGAR